MQKATMGQPATNQHGSLLITTALVETGIHLFVSDGVQRIDELTKTFADRDQAAAYYRHIAQAAEQGKRIHQIVWEVQALEEAQNAATSRTPDEIAESLNADATAYLAAETEVHNRVVQIRDEVMADADPNWRANLRKQVVQAAPARKGRTVRNTKTRVFLKPLDPAQVRAIQLHRDGIVYAGNGVTRPTLAAIHDKGFGVVNYQPGLGRRRVIASITLNADGLAVAATQNEVAA